MSEFGRVVSIAIATLLVVLGSAVAARAEKRVALVIGNIEYQYVPRLNTAVNDARIIAQTLRQLGFSVLVAENQSRHAMSEALLALDKTIEPGDTAFLFFAGHGFEIHGQNYLLPIDVPAAEEGQEELVRDAAFAADRIVERLQARGARVAIMVLDACRNNPFERPGARAVRGTGGLSAMPPVEGVFILFSAGAKQLALDRLSKNDSIQNSVFTRNFALKLLEPGLSLVQIAKRTQADVKRMAATVNHVQTPAYYDQIVGDVVLNDPPDKAASAAKSAAVQVALPSAVEKLPLQPRDTVVAPGNEALAELDALAKAENWHELGDHLTDIKPTARDLHWNGLVEQAAIGELTPLASPSGGSVAERLAMIKRYYPTFPSLRSSPQFRALRASIGLYAFARCFDEGQDDRMCRDSLDQFVRVPPMSAELIRDAAHVVARKLNRAAAAPFFALALEAPQGDLACASGELAETVIAALGRPPDWAERKAATTLTERCWDALRTAVMAQVARETASSYYVRNACPTLMKYNALTGLRAAQCREIMAQ